jgi:phage repressor protein C with HTH and peptisase S24 domain
MAARIAQAIRAAGGFRTVREGLGLSDTMLRRYAEGKAEPSAGKLARLADFCGVSLDWLVKGDGDPLSADNRTQLSDETVLIPMLDVAAAAGPGIANAGEAETRPLAFTRAYLRSLGVRPDQAHVLIATGDSMEPAIANGALLLVDRSKRRIVDDAIYVVSLDGDVRVKRVQRRVEGGLILRSDNKRYADETLDAGAADRLVVEGRVFWTGRVL